MKPLLLAGAALMIGASIYGVVDYQHTKNKKEFTSMYKDEHNGTADAQATAPAENKTAVISNNSVAADVKKEEAKNGTVVTTNTSGNKTKKAVKKKKKFRFSEFSRAPIRD